MSPAPYRNKQDHHGAEEAAFFPGMLGEAETSLELEKDEEKRKPIHRFLEGMKEDLHQHEAMHDAMANLVTYTTAAQADLSKYDPSTLRPLLEEVGRQMHPHLVDEVRLFFYLQYLLDHSHWPGADCNARPCFDASHTP